MTAVETTFEEARRCPKCESPGADAGSRRGPLGSKIHTIMCRNQRCKWYNTTWIVQVHSDGSVQEATDHVKSYPNIPDRTEAVQRNMEALYEQSLKNGGTEVR